jgi:hypothetical protein
LSKDYRGLQRFDPFNDRMSRNIRNTLSEAFVDALANRNPTSFEEATRNWLSRVDVGIYEQYIEERLWLYRRVFQIIQQERLEEPLATGLVVWNQGLFFEFHDHLERIWHESTGEIREALKGLIEAAGVYIHLQYHHQQAASRLAKKSLDLLSSYCDCLPDIRNLDELMDALKRGDPEPPHLRPAESIRGCS